MLKSKAGDYKTAANLLRQLASFYANDHWSDLELVMLQIYAQCLRYLTKPEEFVPTAIKSLRKMVPSTSGIKTKPQAASMTIPEKTSFLIRPSISMRDVIAASKALSQPFIVTMNKYFDQIGLDPCVRHPPCHDGFQLLVRFRCLLTESFQVQSVQVNISNEYHDQITLDSDGHQQIEPGMNQILLTSRVRREFVTAKRLSLTEHRL